MPRNTKFETVHLNPANRTTNEFNIFSNRSKGNINTRKAYQKFINTTLNYGPQYQRIQENGRIIRRLINPKRDKIIQRSIQCVTPSLKSNTSHQDRENSAQMYRRNHTLHAKIMQRNSYKKEYQLKMENERMGNRIINTGSMVKSIPSERLVYRNNFLKNKMNNGVKAFFNLRSQTRQSKDQFDVQNKQNTVIINQIKPYYGYGPNILLLSKIKIETHPQLKNEDLLYLQLMVKNTKKKLYMTQILSYQELMMTEIKFALRIKKIGQFVPLKIIKVNGLTQNQVGIVDLQFGQYLYEEEQEQKYAETGNSFYLQQGKNIHFNKQGKTRTQVKTKLKCEFRKSKAHDVQSSISLEYMIYRKRYL